MALKGEKWFLKKCYGHVRKRTRLAYLANRALELGFGSEQTGGHIRQACGAVQRFLGKHIKHKKSIRSSPTRKPFRLTGQILTDWLQFFRNCSGGYGQQAFGYNWDTLRGYLTPKYGGRRKGGGGGVNEFEIVMRLMAELL